jgi:hypothetical protein
METASDNAEIKKDLKLDNIKNRSMVATIPVWFA